MKPIVTISVHPDGTHRISAIDEHGERLIEPNVEVAAACGHVWRALVGGSLEYGHVDSFKKLAGELERAAQTVEEAKESLIAPINALTAVLAGIEDLQARMRRIDTLLADRWMSIEATRQWFADLKPGALPPRGLQ